VVPVPKKLNALTSLRFFAAAAIVYLHFSGSLLPTVTSAILGQGVSYFFVLSGFVLTYVYPSLTTWRARRAFLVARIGRIWPAYVAAIGLTLLLAGPTFYDEAFFTNLVVNLLMLQAWNPVDGMAPSINGPSWSISTELGLYIAFMFLIRNFERRWLLALLISAIITGSMIVYGLAFNIGWATSNLPAVTGQSLLYEFPPGRLFEFTAGMCMALLYRKYRISERLGLLAITAIEVAVIALAVFYSVWARDLQVIWYNEFTIYLGLSAVVPACISIYVFANEAGLVSRLLTLAPFVLLGEISYSVYLFHVPVGRYLILTKNPAILPDWSLLVFCLLCILVLSYASWALYETPARNAIRWLLGRSNQRALVPAGASVRVP
jgi:peptidoglycan/LPS O-acetylase OafA/YrhL